MKTTFWQRKYYGVSYWEIMAVLSVYVSSAAIYYLTLEINSIGFKKPNQPFLSLIDFGIQLGSYLIKLLLTIPIWWLIFRKFNYWKLQNRLLLHLITLPLFVSSRLFIYYTILDYYSVPRLRGVGQVWDVYIPALFYILQFGIFHAYQYYHENQKKQQLEAELREAVLKSELSALKAQINPHFLYNVFNTINASIPKEQEKTRMLIAELADLFRYQLKASQSETVLLKDELDFIQKYLHLEKVRFEDRLEICIEVEEDLLNHSVPPMILQPLIENSIKHGLASLIEGGNITLKIQKQNHQLHFSVSDTGIGMKDKSGMFEKGTGLCNTKLRLEKMYNSILQVTDNEPRGLTISFTI
jgi:signal transduction histidine kinase